MSAAAPIAVRSFGGGLTAEDRAARRLGLGASDVPGIVLEPGKAFSTPYRVWASKCLDLPEEEVGLSDPRVVGQVYERPMIEYAARLHGFHVSPKPPTLVHPEHSWVRATPDGIIWSEAAPRIKTFRRRPGFEVATLDAKWITNAESAAGFGEPGTDEVPEEYALQGLWQMACTGLRRHLLVASMFGRAPQVWVIERDDDLLADVFQVAERFWFDYVVTGIEPPWDGSDEADAALDRRFPMAKAPKHEKAPEDVAETMRAYVRARTKREHANHMVSALGQEIKAAIGDGRGFYTSDGFRATWSGKDGARRLLVRAPNEWRAREGSEE